MDFLENFKETRIVHAAELNSSEITTALRVLKPYVNHEPKIPSVIKLNKEYGTFSVSSMNSSDIEKNKDLSTTIKSEQKSSNSNKVYIILKSQHITDVLEYNVVSLELLLNAHFFSHSELFQKFISSDFKLSAYEMIGDIIHLNLTEEQIRHKQIIANILYFKTKKTIINKIGKIENAFRFYKNEVLAGDPSLITIHNENGVKFKMNLNEVYWCSRLQNERIRILSMIQKGQYVCDPFCGVGPHILPAIKKGAYGLCNDLNPNAIKWLKESLKINNLECEIADNMDAGDFIEKIKDKRIDHLIFNLPEYSLNFLKYSKIFKDSIIHCFFFCRENEDVIDMVYKKTGYKICPEWIRKCRNVSPSKAVFKLEVKSIDFLGFQEVEIKPKKTKMFN